MPKTFDELYAAVTIQIMPGRRIKVYSDASDPEWATALKIEVESALETALLENRYIGGRYIDDDGRLTDDPPTPTEVYGEPGAIPVTIELPKD
jgi:hypothetical protein